MPQCLLSTNFRREQPCKKPTELGVSELQRFAGGPERVDGLRALRSNKAILRFFEESCDTIVRRL